MSDPNVPPQPDPNQPQGQPGYGQQPPQQPQQPPQQPQPQQGYQQQPPPQPGYQQPAPAGGPAQPFTQSEENTWGLFSHLIPLIALIVVLAFKERSARLNANAKEALNFQITMLGSAIVLWIVGFIFAFIPYLGWIVWLLVTIAAWALWIAWFVFAIIAAVKSYQGQDYRYPFALRLIK